MFYDFGNHVHIMYHTKKTKNIFHLRNKFLFLNLSSNIFWKCASATEELPKTPRCLLHNLEEEA